MLYIVYLGWSAMALRADTECNELFESRATIALQIIIGLLFTFFTIWNIATASASQVPKDQERVSVGQDVIAEEDEEPEQEGVAVFTVTIPTLIFQFVMLLASLYFGMLFTNWGKMKLEEDYEEFGDYDKEFLSDEFTFWAKLIVQWISITLFVISFSLNICCPDRVL